MIVTVTPNPSLDRTLELPRLERGEVTRSHTTHAHPGGKGVNVARALARHEHAALALLPSGGSAGSELAQLLSACGVTTTTVPSQAPTRSNITLVESDGTTTKINEPGAALIPAESDALCDAVDTALDRSPQWLVAAGSLPDGAPEELYSRFARIAAEHGVPIALDTSGETLRAAAHRGGFALIKPNHEELQELAGRELSTVGEVVTAARHIIRWGNGVILATLGSHGVLRVTAEESQWAGGAVRSPRSTAGAGDCALAGYLAGDHPPRERLRHAAAWGRAAVELPGTTVPGPADVDTAAVDVRTDLPPTLPIKEL